MKILTVLGLGLMVLLNITLVNADGYSESSQDINLYIYGEGGSLHPTMPSNPPGNISTSTPSSSSDEYQIYYLNDPLQPSDYYYWFSDPLKASLSIFGDVHITVWVICNSPRYLTVQASLNIYKSSGEGHAYGLTIDSNLVFDEPVEFSGVLSEEVLPEDLKYFNIGDRIGMGIDVGLLGTQPPAEVRILYNSSEHPSHMTISTNPISIDFSNPVTIGRKPALDVTITDAFGIYDIIDYNVQINGPSGKNIADFEIIEYEYPDHGILILRIIWDKSEDESGNYSFIVKVVDNNNNKWEEIEVFEYDLSNDGIIEISHYLYILSSIGIIIMILIYIFVIRKGKKRD